MSKAQFIKQVATLASADMKKNKVLASLTIAQAILESSYGETELATGGNALFGIKANSTWKGKVYCKDTQECYDGVTMVTVSDATFRAYDNWEDSINDHSAFLIANKRYKAVIGETDYKEACTAIKAAGYATDPNYASKLIKLIEENKLTQYDKTENQAVAVETTTEIADENKKYYRVQAGAFRNKSGANAMAEKVKKTGHTDVYVKLLSGLYKVQVGAYSVKSNAESTVKKLKASGISCFITYA
ncbi:MAG: glucosaminidase domain-containing protein [Lachnotalea sp.]